MGAGVYVTELLQALDPLGADVHVFANGRDSSELAAMMPNTTVHPVRLVNRVARLAWAHYVLPARVKKLGPDVFHGPHYTLPEGLRASGVVTFHDPTFFTLPDLHERSKVVYFTRAARKGISRASRVIAVSEYTRRGAVAHAGADPGDVDVVLHGVDPDRYRPSADEHPLDFEPYVLFVGALEPRKDVPTLIAAFGELVAGGGYPHRLVLAGPPAWGAAEIDAAVSRLPAGSVHKLSYVPEAQKIRLYRRASAFVYPSIAEGFGLPVLEAMACGAPAVTTSGSAPEEIARDAALIVPARDVVGVRDAIRRIIDDAALAADLRRRGLERAAGFTWARTAMQTLDVYRRAADQR